MLWIFGGVVLFGLWRIMGNTASGRQDNRPPSWQDYPWSRDKRGW